MDKALILVLFPFFTVVLLVGVIALYARSGKPVRITLRGLGVSFTLETPKGNQKNGQTS